MATALTIGNFDGAHVGHGSLLRRARDLVGDDGKVVALCFDPHPAAVLAPGSEPARLTTFERRAELLRVLGADEVVKIDPTAELLGQSPEAFIEGLVEAYRPAAIVEGPDFHFGKGRAGTPAVLVELGGRLGFKAEIVEPTVVALRDQRIVTASSTMARWLIERGRVRDAAFVLGRPAEVEGVVVQGDRRGRSIGFATANVQASVMTPGAGVYAAIATVADDRCWAAAVNVGTRPTFKGSETRVEAHLLDVDFGDSSNAWRAIPGLKEYGWGVRLELIAWIRDEIGFGNVDELRGQLERDMERVRSVIGPIGPTRGAHLEGLPA